MTLIWNRCRVGIVSAGLTAFLCMFSAYARAEGTLVFGSNGGIYQESQEKALFRPFADKNGVRLVPTHTQSVAKIKAAVETGTVQWDLLEVTEQDYVILSSQGLLEPIDYSVFDKTTINSIDEPYRGKYGLGSVIFSNGIGYRTDTGTAVPHTWKEFWDIQAFPGARGLNVATYNNTTWESALLADGVTPDQIYPIDFDRALKSLDRIKGSVKVWSSSSASAIQALIAGDITYAVVPNGRLFAAKAEGAKIDFDYNQAFISANFWVIPKGAPNKHNAMLALGYISQARPSAELMKLLPYSTPNKEAINLLDPDYAKTLPTYPGNLSRQIKVDATWYSSGRNQETSLKVWNDWYGQ